MEESIKEIEGIEDATVGQDTGRLTHTGTASGNSGRWRRSRTGAGALPTL